MSSAVVLELRDEIRRGQQYLCPLQVQYLSTLKSWALERERAALSYLHTHKYINMYIYIDLRDYIDFIKLTSQLVS